MITRRITSIGHGAPGIVHGSLSYLLQDEWGQVTEAESISAGLDYPGVGPEHSHLHAIGRARYEKVTDAEVIDAFQLLSRTEGIIPALEPAHAIAWISRDRAALAGKTVLVNLSGRGDKDVAQMMDVLATGQRAAKHLLCYDAMLIHVRLSLPNFQAYVTPWRGVPPTLPTGVTRATHSALLLCSCASGTLIGAVGVLAGFRRRLPACWTQTLVGHGLTSLEVLPNDNRSKP